jgi:hypothetical protein
MCPDIPDGPDVSQRLDRAICESRRLLEQSERLLRENQRILERSCALINAMAGSPGARRASLWTLAMPPADVANDPGQIGSQAGGG